MILQVPGDKSISQRALILGALTKGTIRVTGLLPGADPRSTAGALRALGADIPAIPPDGSEIAIRGRGVRDLLQPTEPLDLGNSGTGARLLLGVLSGQPIRATVTGDDSLRSRPMRRITDPLRRMGADFRELREEGCLPIEVVGGDLRPVEYELPVASAQVKSSLLLAGLVSGSFVLLTEPGRSRDHTERMLRAAGASVVTHAVEGGWRVELRDPPEALVPADVQVPGDFSSAAFFLVLTALGGSRGSLTLQNVGLNPTRTGLLPILKRMGMKVDVDREGNGEDDGIGEPLGSLTVRPGSLEATTVGADEIPAAIDEVPILAVAAARAQGVTRITGAEELRVKETDRLAALAQNLRAVGVEVEELDDGLEIEGSDRPLRGRVRSFDDHRIAMAFGVLGALPGNDIEVRGSEAVDVSYPTFWDDLRRVSGRSSDAEPDSAGSPGDERVDIPDGPVVTLDGPAGSGKSTTAREAAARLGFRHLDSGAFYRALTWALLQEDVPPDEWSELSAEDLDRQRVSIEPTGAGFRIQVRGRELSEELRTEEVTRHVSELARLPAVRRWLLDVQREAGSYGSLVADGRDMGTVVFPDAEVKFFLTADLEERARRRLAEGGTPDPDPEELARQARRIEARDRQDSEREHSPLRRPPDAVVLDTTEMDFEDQVRTVVLHVRAWQDAKKARP